ncbi:MAG: hypothetical protein GWP18_06270 [Proteobacteria bacterium]|nr:hypothetical protein [Pseudomonadota bacterium]
MNREPEETTPSQRRRGAMGSVMQRRGVFGALIVIVALVVSACGWYLEGLGDKTPETCECPTLEATVASIDWTGDGREPDEIRQAVGFAETGQLPLVVSATYRGVTSGAERDELFEHVVSVMTGIGIAPFDKSGSPGRDRRVQYAGDGWTLAVSTHESGGELFVLVTTNEPDENTPEYLAPLVEAFGTR